MKIKHLQSELKEKKKNAQAIGKEYTSLQDEYNATSKQVSQIKVQSCWACI